MAKSKYETHVESYLDKVKEWASKEMIEKDNAKNLNICVDSF